MSQETNVTVVRDNYAALAKADLDHIQNQLLADDVVYHVPGTGPLAGEYRGKTEVVDYLRRLIELGGTLDLQPAEVLASEEYAATLLHARGEREGKTLDERGVQVFRLSGTKIAERWSYPPDLGVTDAFFR